MITPIHWRHTGGLTMPEVWGWMIAAGLFWWGVGRLVGWW